MCVCACVRARKIAINLKFKWFAFLISPHTIPRHWLEKLLYLASRDFYQFSFGHNDQQTRHHQILCCLFSSRFHNIFDSSILYILIPLLCLFCILCLCRCRMQWTLQFRRLHNQLLSQQLLEHFLITFWSGAHVQNSAPWFAAFALPLPLTRIPEIPAALRLSRCTRFYLKFRSKSHFVVQHFNWNVFHLCLVADTGIDSFVWG